MNEEPAVIGQVTIAPQVLTTIVRQTVLANPGVQSLAARSPRRSRRKGRRAEAPGIEVTIGDEGVAAVVHIIAKPDANMMRAAVSLQDEISRAIELMTGLAVADVSVFVDDVYSESGDAT
ncbi:MAG: Asp23/Gls24 family envelope stress response protein [Caldilineales bacterium]|nr:Asp23/Gls24 family envelope stress response protein [Caldilineales bacterium]